MPSSQQGYFLIADITGYTMYLSQSELEHAQGTLTSLLELLIEHTRPPLIISRLAGDAVISYGLRDNFFQGQTFVEMIEDTYVAFRKAIDLMALNNTCQCSACANVSALDLKFFVHYGTFGIQRLSAHDELVGSDVNLVHRLLKNNVTAETGFKAYTIYTEAAIRQLGIEDICKTMQSHTESYEHLGAVQVWVQDMHPVWTAKKDQTRIEIPPEDVLVREEAEFPIPPHRLWEILANPAYRAVIMHSVKQVIHNRQDGRLAPGSVYQCYHGDGRETIETILEWQPFEQMTTEDTTPVPKTTCLVNVRLIPIRTGTRMVLVLSKARGPFLNRIACNLVGGILARVQIREGMRAFRELMAAELAEGVHRLPAPAALPAEDIEQSVETNLESR